MSELPFPAPGPDGDAPPPGDGARDGAARPGGGKDDDYDADADLARFIADIDAGLIEIPPEPLEGRPAGPAVSFTLGEAADVDPAELAVMAGPDGLGGQVFAQDRTAGAMRPGPLLSVLAEQAAEDPAGL